MIFAVAPPLVVAARREIQAARRRRLAIRRAMPLSALRLYFLYAYAADARGRPGEVGVYELVVQPDRLEYLRAAVAAKRGYAHLGHNLQDALVRRLDVVLRGVFAIGVRPAARRNQVGYRVKGDVRVHRARAVAQQQRQMRHLARLARLHHKPNLCADALPYEVVMNSRHREQAGYRDLMRVHAPIRQDDDCVALINRLRRLFAHAVERALEGAVVLVAREQRPDGLGFQARQVYAADLFQLGVGKNGALDRQHPAMLRRFGEQVHFGAKRGL